MTFEKINIPEKTKKNERADFTDVKSGSSQRTIENKIAVALEGKKILPDDKIDRTSQLIFGKLGVSTESLIGFETRAGHLIAYYENSEGEENYITLNVKDTESGVEISQVHLTPEDLSQMEYKKEKDAIVEITSKLSDLEKVLNAMEAIFQNNTGSFWNGTLDEEDVFTPDTTQAPWNTIENLPPRLDLIFLQQLAQEMITEVQKSISESDTTNKNIQASTKTLGGYTKRYIDYVMGLSEDYEGGAALFKESKSETGVEDNPETSENESIAVTTSEDQVFAMIDLMVESMSPDEMLQYLADTHYKIDRNQYQSTEVERSYDAWRHKVHTTVLDALKTHENIDDKYFLEYSKIVTGRPGKFISQQIELNAGKSIFDNNRIDNRYKDPAAARDALLFVCQRENGVISKIQTDPESNFKVEDERIGKLSPIDVVDLVTDSIQRKGEGFSEKGAGSMILDEIGFGDIVKSVNSETKYHDLSIEQKMKLGVLIRVHDTLNRKRKKVGRDELGKIFLSAVEESQDVLTDSFEDNFNKSFGRTKSAEDFNLTEVDSEIFELYMDIQGVGFFDLADSTKSGAWEIAKMGAVFAPIIAVAFGTGMFLMPALALKGIEGVVAITITAAAGAAAGGTTSVILSPIVHPKGFDKKGEILLEAGSDFGVGAGLGALVAGGMAWKGLDSLKYLAPEMALGMGFEVLRSFEVESYLYGKDKYSLPEFYEFIEIESKTLRAMRDGGNS